VSPNHNPCQNSSLQTTSSRLPNHIPCQNSPAPFVAFWLHGIDPECGDL
jgi:hypothetical protein